ncbi:hypothetical protein Acor_78840 [Acrocarpospora corrugata]|uniref:Uncharacterized protein n=1 Tax=Acrocarpospora corrugata TaxID=35763 RepID=A0A5M3W9S5_9ACTN|nr:hypothetical protein Acor_78840 [Acrocarpospora corrugata]
MEVLIGGPFADQFALKAGESQERPRDYLQVVLDEQERMRSRLHKRGIRRRAGQGAFQLSLGCPTSYKVIPDLVQMMDSVSLGLSPGKRPKLIV